MQQPHLLAAEYTRRLESTGSANDLDLENKQIVLALKRVNFQEDRMTDAYRKEAMDLNRYKMEMDKLAHRRKERDRMQQDIELRSRQEDSSRKALEQLQRLFDEVKVRLDNSTFEERQQFLRLVVEDITVAEGVVKVETVLPTDQDVKLRNARGELVEP